MLKSINEENCEPTLKASNIGILIIKQATIIKHVIRKTTTITHYDKLFSISKDKCKKIIDAENIKQSVTFSAIKAKTIT